MTYQIPMKRKQRDTDRSVFNFPSLNELCTSDASYQAPLEIAHFSYDENRKLLLNCRSKLSYYYPPVIGSSLSVGFPENFTKRDPEVLEGLDALLHSIKDMKQRGKKVESKFVTWRGIMTKFLCTPYATKDSYDLLITKTNGTIYIQEDEVKKQLSSSSYGNTERDQLMTYWGYKFESLSCIPVSPAVVTKAQLEDREHGHVNTKVQYCSVFKSKIGNHTLVCGGEVDCIDTGRSKDDPSTNIPRYYTELKTSRVITTQRQEDSFQKFKLMKVWAQSYLSGVPKVIFGFRDDDGRICGVKTMYTTEIPKNNRFWNSKVCISFASKILDFIDDFFYDVDSADKVFRLTCNGKQIVMEEEEEKRRFLPEWFT